MALRFGLVQKEDWNYPDNFTSRKGFPREVLNLIYNTADCQLSTTLGEGWGLPLTEAMAAKTINVAPNITSIPELFNSTNLDSIDNPDQFPSYKLRGIPVKAGSTSSEWTCHGAVDLERIRPLTNVDDAVKKLLWVYDHPQEVKAITNRAYNWVKRLTWERVAQKWDKLFQKIYQELEKERAHPKKTRLKKAPKLL